MKNIIHLSDLHISANKKFGFFYEDCINVIDKLVEDLRYLQQTYDVKFDTVFFTGDLAFSGAKEEFDLFDKHVRTRIIDELSLNRNDFHILPGNHDVCRSDVSFFERSNRNANSDFVEELFTAVNGKDQKWDRLNNYKDYESSLGAQDYTDYEFLFKTKKVNSDLYLVFLNSAWLCMDDNDKENLFITKSQFTKATKNIPRNAKIILLTHHPIDWLCSEDRVKFSSFLEKKVSLMFFGHMHEFKQIRESNFREDITVFLQAGTLDSRELYSGYSCVLLNNINNISDGRVIYRKFDKDKSTFTSWDEYGDEGRFDFTTENSLTFDSEKFSEISQGILNKVDKDHLINIGYSEDKKKSLRKFYSEPNFHPVEMLPHIECKLTSTDQINKATENVVIVGGSYSGKTAVLKYLYAKCLEKQVNRDFSNFSFYYDCNESKSNTKNKILQNLISIYFASQLNTSFEEKIKRMLTNGFATIFLDNVDKLNPSENEAMNNFIKEYPKCKYVFSIDQINTQNFEDKLSSFGIENYTFVSLGQLKRKNVRDIVSRWDESYVNSYQNTLFRELNKLIENSQLPHNYFIYSMLLAIYELKSEIQGILTEADIIENFIEILLRKHCINKDKSQPQFKELMHFMGFLSKSYYEKDVSHLIKNDITQIALNFNVKTLYSFNAEQYIDPLISSGLLKKENDKFYFSQPCFLYYSVAYFMNHDDDLRAAILVERNLIICDKVIEYYSALNASKFDTIEIIDQIVAEKRKIISEIMYDLHKVDIENIKDFDINETPILDSFSENAAEFLAEMEEVKSDRDTIDEKMDTIAPLKERQEGHKKVFNQRKEQDADDKLREFVQILSLFSRVFRNIELSMEKERLMKVFSNIVDNYLFIMKSIILTTDSNILVPMLENKLKEFSGEGKEFTEKDIDDLICAIKQILPLVRSAMPNYIQTLMAQDLMSKKPRMETILNLQISSSEDSLSKALLFYVLMDNNDTNIRNCVNELQKLKSNLVNDSLFIKLSYMVNTHYNLSQDDKRFIKGAIQKLLAKGKVHINQSVIDNFSKIAY